MSKYYMTEREKFTQTNSFGKSFLHAGSNFLNKTISVFPKSESSPEKQENSENLIKYFRKF